MSITNSTWLVHNALWTILEAESDFTSTVAEDNRIKYTDTSDRHPDKQSASTGDFPLVRIRPMGLRPKAHHTSNSSVKELLWSIEVFTAEQQIATNDSDKLADVSDAIYKAMVDWKTTMSTFTHANHGFVVPWCGTIEVQDALTDDEFHHNQRGWKSVWQGETDVWFQTSSLT